MNVSIRKFEKLDIPNKVSWINDPANNTFLHYDLPLRVDQTEEWFEKNKARTDRYDGVIEVNGVPVGLIGLLSIDRKNRKAEYYITIGAQEYLRKGIAGEASRQLLEYAFAELGLNRVYLYTEVENWAAVRSYERIGFRREGVIRNDLFSKGRFVDRYLYGITKNDFYQRSDTPIQKVFEKEGNHIYIKREDMIPFSFGGNKARKAQLFFEEIDRGTYNHVVTYGSNSSNHCRVIANMAAARGLPCIIISPEETSETTYNSVMMKDFGAKIITCPVTMVRETIDRTLADLREKGEHPYFIAGGGHGNIGTQAYVNCYEEIRRYERASNIHFDFIFHASGTGTTQAGLVCGQLIEQEDRKIIGISIARPLLRGRDVVVESVRAYLNAQGVDVPEKDIEAAVVFIDDYIGKGYGSSLEAVERTIREAMIRYGIPLDNTYTGKAFFGMLDQIEKESLTDKNILFIHTGGTPLFFDGLRRRKHGI